MRSDKPTKPPPTSWYPLDGKRIERCRLQWRLWQLLPGLLALCLAGCSTTGGDSLPKWVMSPPADNGLFIYGVGEGKSMRSARDDALGLIAGKLKTHVQTDVRTETVLADGEETSTTRNRVQTTTEALKLSDYQTLKSDNVGGRRYVLVALDRPTLINTLAEELDTLDQELKGKLGGQSASVSSLKRLYRLNSAQPVIREALATLSLIESIDQSGLQVSKRSSYNSLLSERERLFQSIRLGVTADRHTAVLRDIIIGLLLKKGIHAERTHRGQPYSGEVRISAKEKEATMFGEKHVSLRVQLELLNEKGTPVTTSQFTAGAASLSSYEAARIGANRLIGQDIEAQGIWKALNMQGGG